MFLKLLFRLFSCLKGIHFNVFRFFYEAPLFFSGFYSQKENKRFRASVLDLYPIFSDKTKITPIDPIYFYQNAWCASLLFKHKPTFHYDIGSHIGLVSIISQSIPTTMVDIRPVELPLHGLSFVRGNICSLPFDDESIKSLSSICVIEHIGLGRYGDSIDAFGSEKAALELCRVLTPGGFLYISVPVDHENISYCNAHRAFTRDYVLEIFSGLLCVEEKYLYGKEIFNTYNAAKGFGTGMFCFTKK